MYLCDHYFGYEGPKVDLYGIFGAIQPLSDYPFTRGPFFVYSQLVNGHGKVPFRLDIVYANSDELLFSSAPQLLDFPTRTTVIQFAFRIPAFRFHQPGRYLFELYCDSIWVCDCPLQLVKSAKGP